MKLKILTSSVASSDLASSELASFASPSGAAWNNTVTQKSVVNSRVNVQRKQRTGTSNLVSLGGA